MHYILIALAIVVASPVKASNRELEKKCFCSYLNPHKSLKEPMLELVGTMKVEKVITGIVTHVRDGDTLEVAGVAIRLAALNCPEKGTKNGEVATKIAKRFAGLKMTCKLTGAKSYDRLVGYCAVNGLDFGRYMMENSSCKVWKKFDVWDRY